jgi:hypothetical protein
MRSLRQSTLAALIALISTAALGPGTFFKGDPVALGQQPSRHVMTDRLTAFDLPEILGHAQAGQPAGRLFPLLLDELPEQAQFSEVDFAQAAGNGGFAMAGGPASFPGLPGHADVYAGNAYGLASAYGSAGSTGSAHASRQRAQLAGGDGVLANTGGRSSGFLAAAAPVDFVVIPPGVAAPVDRDVAQLPLLSLVPTPADFDGGSETGAAADAVVNAVPEPATGFLLGLGLLGLLGARRSRHTPPAHALPA